MFPFFRCFFMLMCYLICFSSCSIDPCIKITPRIISEPCCFGREDTCVIGASCFKKKSDEKAFCYRTYSFEYGDECSEDIQCKSEACDKDLKKCLASFGGSCSKELGCAPGRLGYNICDYEKGKCISTEGNKWIGESCGADVHCRAPFICDRLTKKCKNNSSDSGSYWKTDIQNQIGKIFQLNIRKDVLSGENYVSCFHLNLQMEREDNKGTYELTTWLVNLKPEESKILNNKFSWKGKIKSLDVEFSGTFSGEDNISGTLSLIDPEEPRGKSSVSFSGTKQTPETNDSRVSQFCNECYGTSSCSL